MKLSSLAPASYLALISILLVACGPFKRNNKECQQDGYSNYQFYLPFYYTPHTDTIKLGDTLWVESSFSNQLYNEKDGKTYTLNNFQFGLQGVLNDLSTNPTIPYTGFILVDSDRNVDNASQNGMYFDIAYTYSQNNYYWKRGIVLNKPGAFFVQTVSFLLLDPISYTGQSITKCPKEYVDIRDKRMNGNNNYYLIKTSPDPYAQQGEEAYKNCFIFYVKE